MCERFHAGFSNEGFMYCSRDETLLTWDAYDPEYRRLTESYPWMLAADEQKAVESAAKPCPCGGMFAFANAPRCPSCHDVLAPLDSAREYFLVTGRRLRADADAMWLADR